MIQFGRRASVFIGFPGQTGIDLTGLRVVFQISKSKDKSSNPAEVIIYNLTKDTRIYAKQKNIKLILSCGYDQGMNSVEPQLKTTFFGDIIESETSKESSGGNITKFSCSDSINSLSSGRVDATFNSGSSIQNLLSEATKALNINLGEVQNFDGKQFVNGYTASGLARDQLDILALKTDTIWSIQDGVLQFLAKDGGFTKDTVVVLNSNTGLVGTPNQKKLSTAGSTSAKRDGIQFISLLNPEIKPGRRVQIESNDIEGIYVVSKVTHRGDTRTGPWYSECEAE